jgi:hypothetical protein
MSSLPWRFLLLPWLLFLQLPTVAKPQWQLLPPEQQYPGVSWEALPTQPKQDPSTSITWQPIEPPSPAQQVVWQPVPAGEELPTLIAIPNASDEIKLPPPPQLYAFNRSIAFGTGPVGPDIAWRVPTGFQWTPHHWFDATVSGFSRNTPGQSFWAYNGGDAVGGLAVNVINSQRWSFGLNQTIRSVNPSGTPSSTTTNSPFGQGQSTGFRLAYALSPTAGIALGGEQVIQWDSYTDTGRTFYLAFSKGWWLGHGAEPYPLLIGNAALASGRFASDPASRFGCTDTGANRTGFYAIDNQLCWAPVGSLAVVLSPELSLFSEYNSVRWAFGTSLAPIADVPFRATWAVNVLNQIPQGNEFNRTTWSFRLSLGF